MDLPPIRGSQPRWLKEAGLREVGGLEEGVARVVVGGLQREGQVGLLHWKPGVHVPCARVDPVVA